MAGAIEPIYIKLVTSLIRPSFIFAASAHQAIQSSFRGILTSRQKSTFSKTPLEPNESIDSQDEARTNASEASQPHPPPIKRTPSTMKPNAKLMRKVYMSDKALFGELLETKKQKTARLKKEAKELKSLRLASQPEFSPDQPYYTDNSGNSKVLFQPNNRQTRPPKSLPASDTTLLPKESKEWKDLEPLISPGNSSDSSSQAEANWAAKMSPKMIKVIDVPPVNDTMNEGEIEPVQVTATETQPEEPVTAKPLFLPSVSKILNLTMPQEQAEALERWQAKMTAQLGVEGFRSYKENMLNNGRMLHSNIETYLRGTSLSEIVVAEGNAGHWKSLQHVLPLVQDARVIESRVVHPELQYCGIVDCVAQYKDKLVLIDWKTSQKQKFNIAMTYDTPIQIAAYIGAINSDPNFSLKIDEGLIVIAYEDGSRSHTYLLKPVDVALYWQKWTERVKLYFEMSSPKKPEF